MDTKTLLKTLGIGVLICAVSNLSSSEVAIAKQNINTKKAVPVTVKNTSTQSLELRIDTFIQNQRREGSISRDERTSWYVYDLTADKMLVNIHGDEMYQSASMAKPLFWLAYYHKVNTGEIRYDEQAKEKLRNMIQYNKGVRKGNNAANWFIKKVGGPKEVQKILKKHYGHIFQNTSIVEYIGQAGKTYNNKVSAHDYSRFLYALINNKIPGAKELKYTMGLENRDRIYNPDGTKIYDKTGTTARMCGNMGVVYAKGKDGKNYPYIFVGIIEKAHRAENYNQWAHNRGIIINEVSKMVYQTMSPKYNLR